LKSEFIPLSKYCDSIDYGYTESASSKEIGPKFLRITDIVKKTIDWSLVPYCKISDTNFKKFELHDEDIVIARTGNTTGESNYISNPPKAVFASYLIRLKINDSCDPLFIHYFLKSKTYVDHIYSLLGEKSAQKNANAKSLTEVKTSFPSKQIQTKIANTLHTLTRKIESLQNQNRILEQMSQVIFKSWFVDFDGVTEFEDSELGQIPKGWKVKKLGEIIKKNQGVNTTMAQVKYSGNGYTVIRAKNISQNKIDFENIVFVDKNTFSKLEEPFKPKKGDILYTNIGSKLGNAVIVTTLKQFIIAWNVLKIRLDSDIISSEYLVEFLNSNRDNIAALNSSSTMPFVSGNTISQIKILIPDYKLAKNFSTISNSCFSILSSNQEIIQRLTKTRDALLPKLMSGEIRV